MDYSIFEKTSLTDLKKICKENKIKGYSSKNKHELIELLKASLSENFVNSLKASLPENFVNSLKDLSLQTQETKTSQPTNSEFRNISLELNQKLSKDIRQNNGIYFTPKKARTKIFDFLHNLKFEPKTCLEPSFGSAEFISDLIEKYPNSNITGVEKNPIIFENVKFNNSKIKLFNQDFLNFKQEKFDLIIGNPPYFVMKDKSNTMIKECMSEEQIYLYYSFINV
jgi:hypothetical protein